MISKELSSSGGGIKGKVVEALKKFAQKQVNDEKK